MNLKVHGANVHGTARRSGDASLPPGFDHLSEDQIDEHLIGGVAAMSAAQMAAHLAECELCVSRVAQAAAPIEDFKAVTLAWSERRSATMPLHQAMARSGARLASFHPRLAWAAAMAAALAVGVAIPVVSHQSSLQHRQEAAQTGIQIRAQARPVTAATIDTSTGPSDQNAQMVRDNQMLQAIDRELDSASESPEALGLRSVSGAAAHKFRLPSSVQD